MDKGKNLKQIVKDMAQRVGTLQAHGFLIGEKVSPSTATKLIKGTYPSQVGELLGAAILRADRASRKLAS